MSIFDDELDKDTSEFSLWDDEAEEVVDNSVDEVDNNETDTTDVVDPIQNEEVEQVAGETTEQKPETTPDQFELEYKFNHQSGKITSKEEAQRLVQIGMLYDNKIKPEYESLKAIQQPYGKLEELATLYGLDVNGLTDALYNQYYESQATETGLTADQVKKDYELTSREKQLQSAQQQKAEEAKQNEMFSRFLQSYPNDAQKIKPETWAKVDQGIDLVTAYKEQIIEEREQQLLIREQNLKNRDTSPVASSTRNGTQTNNESDDLDEAFLGFYQR